MDLANLPLHATAKAAREALDLAMSGSGRTRPGDGAVGQK